MGSDTEGRRQGKGWVNIKIMKKVIIKKKSKIVINKSYEGEPLERKIAKMMESKEPIGADAPMIYTERKDGVLPDYDIRTDRFDIAVEHMDKLSRSYVARRSEIPTNENKKGEETSVNTSDDK